jgi:hypothetical protein
MSYSIEEEDELFRGFDQCIEYALGCSAMRLTLPRHSHSKVNPDAIRVKAFKHIKLALSNTQKQTRWHLTHLPFDEPSNYELSIQDERGSYPMHIMFQYVVMPGHMFVVKQSYEMVCNSEMRLCPRCDSEFIEDPTQEICIKCDTERKHIVDELTGLKNSLTGEESLCIDVIGIIGKFV